MDSIEDFGDGFDEIHMSFGPNINALNHQEAVHRAMDRVIIQTFGRPMDNADLVELEHMWALPARGEGV